MPPKPVMRRAVLAAGLVTALLALSCKGEGGPAPSSKASASSSALRVVSLAPAVTETLFAIGAGNSVVGVSDYCEYPPEASKLPRLGTSITPNYEAIARLNPTLLISEDGASARRKELEALAPTLLLPWLTLGEVTFAIAEIGKRVGRAQAGLELSRELHAKLDIPEPTTGPRVLLVLGYEPGKFDEVWFVRKNSLHGAALHAAGARNAVSTPYQGAPRISPERVLELDPDLVLVLLRPNEEHHAAAYLEDWRKLSGLRAVKEGHVRAVRLPEAFANGPRILKLVERLREEVRGAALP